MMEAPQPNQGVTMGTEHVPGIDETPEADAAEQQATVYDEDEEAGLDTAYLADIGDREANEADVIDQAIIIPTPDEEQDLP